MVFATKSAPAANLELNPELVIDGTAFPFMNHEGETQTLADYKGKWVVVNFWATWCAPCVAELPALAEFKKHYEKQKLEVLLLGLGNETREQFNAFLYKHKIEGIRSGKDENSTAFHSFDGNSIPTSLIINPKGEVVGRVVGDLDWMSENTLLQFDNWLGLKN